MKAFISKLNWRQILVHFFAAWFFIHAFKTFSFLYNTKLVGIVRHSHNRQELNKMLAANGTMVSYFISFSFWQIVSGSIGLVVAFIISLTISVKRHWFWVNALIVFIATYFLYGANLLGWGYLKQFVWFFGQRFNNYTTEFIINGIILLSIGLLIFFLKPSIQFIEKGKSADI